MDKDMENIMDKDMENIMDKDQPLKTNNKLKSRFIKTVYVHYYKTHTVLMLSKIINININIIYIIINFFCFI